MKNISSPPVKIDNLTLEKNAAQEIQAKAGVLSNYADIGFKIIVFTRDCTAASGNVTYTGIGFRPRAVLFVSVNDAAGLCNSTGFLTSLLSGGIAMNYLGTGQQVSKAVGSWSAAAGAHQSAMLSSLDADGFTLTWEKLGAPVGILYARAFCFR